MLKNIFIPIIILLFSLSACGQIAPASPSPTPSGGIEGTVIEGPMCPGPVPIGNNPCPDQPYKATITILNSDNIQVAQIETDANGYFKIQLPAGTYVLHPESGNPLPRAADQTVVVIDGQYTQVSIQYDTGMR